MDSSRYLRDDACWNRDLQLSSNRDFRDSYYFDARPRGVAKVYSTSSKATTSDFYTSSKKILEPQYQEDPKVSCKKHINSGPSRNPITQDDACFQERPQTSRRLNPGIPSPQLIFDNQKKHMLPSELGYRQL